MISEDGNTLFILDGRYVDATGRDHGDVEPEDQDSVDVAAAAGLLVQFDGPSDDAGASDDGVGEGSDEDDSEELKPYTEWTNTELRTELSSRNLPVDGKKLELVARLEESDAAAGAGDEDADDAEDNSENDEE